MASPILLNVLMIGFGVMVSYKGDHSYTLTAEHSKVCLYLQILVDVLCF